MARENPSFLDECWEAPVPGAIYAEEIDRARAEGRVSVMPVDGNMPVLTFWDIGAPLQTVVLYVQAGPAWIDIVDCDMDIDETLIQRVARMKQKGYAYGAHYLPHDEIQTQKSGVTMGNELAAHWLKMEPGMLMPDGMKRANMRHLPRTQNVEMGINQTLQMFSRFRFRVPQCEALLERLALYRRGIPTSENKGDAKPVKDWTNHCADAMRYIAEAFHANMVKQQYAGTDKGAWRGSRGVYMMPGMKPRVVSGLRV
jgi:hypothetical protein